jgi:hypothetical protein
VTDGVTRAECPYDPKLTPNEIGAEEQSPRIIGLFDLKYRDAKAKTDGQSGMSYHDQVI